MGTSANAKVSLDATVERMMQRANKEQVTRLVTAAAASSGEAVSTAGFDPGDDICPTFRFPYPLPPRFNQFVEAAALVSGSMRLFPYGIINPEGILVQVNVGPLAE